LADVRNSGYVPIAKPCGLPFDVSPEVVAISEWWGDEGFSHSYLTVAELLGYDWTQVITIGRFVSALAYWEWGLRGRQHGEGTESWIRYIGNRGFPEAEMRTKIESATKHCKTYLEQRRAVIALGDKLYSHFAWEQPYYRASFFFFSGTLPRLSRLGQPDDVRIVFWFDS